MGRRNIHSLATPTKQPDREVQLRDFGIPPPLSLLCLSLLPVQIRSSTQKQTGTFENLLAIQLLAELPFLSQISMERTPLRDLFNMSFPKPYPPAQSQTLWDFSLQTTRFRLMSADRTSRAKARCEATTSSVHTTWIGIGSIEIYRLETGISW